MISTIDGKALVPKYINQAIKELNRAYKLSIGLLQGKIRLLPQFIMLLRRKFPETPKYILGKSGEEIRAKFIKRDSIIVPDRVLRIGAVSSQTELRLENVGEGLTELAKEFVFGRVRALEYIYCSVVNVNYGIMDIDELYMHMRNIGDPMEDLELLDGFNGEKGFPPGMDHLERHPQGSKLDLLPDDCCGSLIEPIEQEY